MLHEIQEHREMVNCERLTRVRCSLCMQTYKLVEAEHLIPLKMLAIFKIHTLVTNRSKIDLSHIRIHKSSMLSQTMRVCYLCSRLVLEEYELY
jgi:hypothetical protein